MSVFRLFLYNYVRRPIQNWRVRRMWLACEGEPDRPRICPQAGIITQDDIKWAESVISARR